MSESAPICCRECEHGTPGVYQRGLHRIVFVQCHKGVSDPAPKQPFDGAGNSPCFACDRFDRKPEAQA